MKKETTFREWLTLVLLAQDMETLELEKMSRPAYVGGIETPENLSGMTMGQMLKLSGCANGRELFYTVTSTLLHMNKESTDKARAIDVVRFVGWVIGKVKQINDLFDKTKKKPTALEVRAGIDKLSFGIFGLVDWYAQRMGITDHEEVMDVPWVRVWQCLDMDTKTAEYRKRYNQVLADEYKRRK